jgi:fructokinase
MTKKTLVAGIGELLWDLLPSGRQLGGAPCNFAFHAMQVGCNSLIITAIGSDEPGRDLLQSLQQLGMPDRYIQRNGYPTGSVTVSLDERGQPDYTIHEQVAWDFIRWDQEMEKLAPALDAVCFGSLAQRNPVSEETILKLVESVRPDCLKVFDINLRQHYFSREKILKSIRLADILKLNENELPVVCEIAGIEGDLGVRLKRLATAFNLRYVVYTMGGQGSVIAGLNEYSFLEAPQVEVADSVGAGDAFTAVLTAGLLKSIPLEPVHRKATEIAAEVCRHKGATPRLPNMSF